MDSKSFAAGILLAGCLPAQDPPVAPVRWQAVPFPQVRIADAFFAPRRAVNVQVTLQHALDQLESTGTLANFDLAATGARDGHRGYVFQDSDAYKAIEAIACALAERRDPELEARLDAVIARIAAAQQPDGYLNTAYTVQQRARFSNLRDDHELYCAGHLFEAAAAHFHATGKRSLLDVATRYADLLVRTFGDGPEQRLGCCGHPEIELALVSLAQATGNGRYGELAGWFLDQRGRAFFAHEHGVDARRYDGSYWIDHVPVRQLQRIAGHAVRAAYLMAGAVDVAALRNDQGLLAMARRVWRNTIERNTFVTGGIGPSAANEGFTTDYDLPTHTAYQESCASIALLLWAHRMYLLTGEASYGDAMETALYNAIPAGVQLDGTRFFYVNPLASRGSHHRREWFGCACCPPNLARTLARLGDYVAAAGNDTVSINLFVRGELRAAVSGGELALAVATEHPWDGRISIRVLQAPERPVRLLLRVPGWCRRAVLQLNGAEVRDYVDAGPCHAELQRSFAEGDEIRFDLDMPVRRLEADPRALALRGMVAFARGPIVYCVEQADSQVPVEGLAAAPGLDLVPQWRPDHLGGVVVLRGELLDGGDRSWPPRTLYREAKPPARTRVELVPYAVWDNRTPGAMATWLPTAPPPPRIIGPEHSATIGISFRNWNCDPEGLRDGEEPSRSSDAPARNCHFWNHLGGTEWVEYAWSAPQRLAGSRIYWFDDTGRGACRLPKAARLLYRDGDAWRPVEAVVPIAADRWCEVEFAAVTTTALRLQVEQQDGKASGILEWRVLAADED